MTLPNRVSPTVHGAMQPALARNSGYVEDSVIFNSHFRMVRNLGSLLLPSQRQQTLS